MRYGLVCAFAALVLGTAWVLVRWRGTGSVQEAPAGVEASGFEAKAPAAHRVQREEGLDSRAVRIRGYSIQTGSVGGRCVVSYVIPAQSGQLMLEVLSPCSIVLDHRREPQTFSYGQAEDAVTVAAVAGGPPAAEGTLDPVLSVPCGTQVQGLLFQDGRLEASPQMFQGSTICPGAGIDEKMFRMFVQQRREGRSP